MNNFSYIFGASGQADQITRNKKLQVRIGSSIETLQVAKVNDDNDPHFIDSPYFNGQLVVRIKNFNGITPDGQASTGSEEYFEGKKRLFALQLSGRFKHEYTVDDVVFGSQFEKKCTPPYGTSIAMKFANLIDPALQTDVFCASPWIFSPMLCSMNVVNVTKATKPILNAAPSIRKSLESFEGGDKENEVVESILGPDPEYIPPMSTYTSASVSKIPAGGIQLNDMLEPWRWSGGKVELEEDTTVLQGDTIEFSPSSWAERRKHFQKPKVRKSTVFSPNHIYNFEIYAPFINLNSMDLSLGINVNIMPYLGGQPLRMMAKSLSLNKYLFVIEFDLVDDSKPKLEAKSSQTKLK